MNQLPVNQITSLIPEKLCFQAKQLNSTLKSIQPNSEIAQLITYTLIATAIVGITVYHYITLLEFFYSQILKLTILYTIP